MRMVADKLLVTVFVALCVAFVARASGKALGGDAATTTDRYGTPLPRNALLRLGATRCWVEGYATSVLFSPDGIRLAASDSRGLLYLWEAGSGKAVRQIDADAINPAVFFSHDGRSIGARTTQGKIRLWDADSGKQRASFERRTAHKYHELFLPLPDRSRLILVSDANDMIAIHNGKHADSYVVGKELPELSIDLIELPSGKLVKQLAKSADQTVFSDAAGSPDGRLLAVAIRAYKAPRRVLHLLDMTSGKLVQEFKEDGEGWFLSVAFSRDGRTIALGSKDEITLLDVATGKPLGRLTAKMTTVAFLAFSPDAKTLVSHSHDNLVRVWDLTTKKVLRQFEAEADGHFVFPLPTGLREPAQHVERFGRSRHSALSPDGKIFAVGMSGCVQLWDTATGRQLFPEQKPADGWGRVAFSPDGRLALIGNWKHARLWDSVTGDLYTELPPGSAHGVFSRDGKRLAFARYGRDEEKEAPTIWLWDIANGKELFRLEHPSKKQFSFDQLAFAPDDQNLLTLSVHQENAGYTDSAMVHRWDTRTGKLQGVIHRKNTYAWGSALAPDGRTAAIRLSAGLLLTDVENDEEVWSRADGIPENWSGYPVFSPDGGFLFVWSRDGHVGMWEVATRSVISRLCLRRDGNIQLASWPTHDADSKKEPEMPVDQASIEALAVSPDGRFVATSEQFDHGHRRASSSRPIPLPVIRVWEAATGKEVQRFEGFRSASTCLAFSPDGRRLASAFHNDTGLVWDLGRTKRIEGAGKLTPNQLVKLWNALGLTDGAKAYGAITALQESPEEAVGFLARHVRPAAAAEADRVLQLIRSLDSLHFAERQASAKELNRLASQFRAKLRKALNEPASLEVKRRIEAILADAPRQLPLESLRTVRCIQILERIGTPDARRHLVTLADGAVDAFETVTANIALHRLNTRMKSDSSR